MKILPIFTSTLLVGALVGSVATVAFAQDPSSIGPSAVTTETYDFGTYMPAGYPHPIELRGQIKYPSDLALGPYPIAVLLHGRHSTCYQGSMPFQEWPCTAGHLPIESFKGYDYLGDILASNGVITISVSVNGINAYDNTVADYGMAFRAEVLQRHLDQMNTWNTAGGYPLGDPNKFVGQLDLSRVATMGHSRGGEGVVTHYNLNIARGRPYGILGVLPLAPVDFRRPNTGDATLYSVETYCDGDVNDLQGVHYFDDVRYNGATNPRYGLIVMGGNHNYFNTMWTNGIGPSTHAADDWTYEPALGNDAYCGFSQPTNGRLTAAQQRAVGGAYMAAFFRTVLNFEDFTGYLTGDWGVPASATFPNRPLYQWYHAADARRRDVNRLLTAANLTVNTLGGAVTTMNLPPNDVCGGDDPEPRFCLVKPPQFSDAQFYTWQPDQTPSALSPTQRGLSMHRVTWSAAGAGSTTNAIPAAFRNVSGFDSIQFRAGVNFLVDTDPGPVQDLTITLSDGTSSASTTVSAASTGGQLFHPPGSYFPHVMGNTIRIALTNFTGVDLTNIQSVRFDYNLTGQGAILISDIAFASAPLPPGP